MRGCACPGCGSGTSLETFDGHYGTRVELDVCHACNGLWFDPHEGQRLTPDSTLALLQSMRERADQARTPLLDFHRCPRCGGALEETMDRVRSVPVTYWACPRGCGRYTTFFQFLREKQYVRDATAAELAALRASVKQVDCSNCGTPIDLEGRTTCAHCGAAVGLFDTASATLAKELSLPEPDPRAPAATAEQVARLLGRRPARTGVDLVDAGLDALFSLLGK